MKSRHVMLAAVLLFFSLCVNAYAYDMVVAQDGSGDYMSIQAAIDAVASNSAARTEIYIKTGLYNAEKLFIPADKQNISLIGESRSETIISYHIYDCSDGHCPVEDAALWSDENIRTSATLTIKGDGFLAENLTLQNTAGPVGQAQAITVRGDKAAFINCDIKSYQDTIYFWNNGKRAYFEGCLIVGRTDYIYGGGVVFFQNCEIRSWGGGWITAPSTPQNQKYGFVFNNCTLTYATGSPRSGDDGRFVALGRPWHNYPKVTWLYCDMTVKIDPLGWPTTWNMSYAATSTDLELYEYKNTGAGADMSGRADWAGIRALNADEAPLYTRQAVLAGNDGWDPAAASDDNGGQAEAEATLTKHGAGSSTQTVNLGEPIDEFYYAWTNATSVNVTGLPSGVNATIDTGARTVTVSGTPAVAGTFKFTVTTVGGANDAFSSGTLTVIDGGSSSDSTNGGTGEASCSNPSNTALPFSKDGAGEYCWVTSGDISDINSWNMQLVEINGETFTNKWSNRMPAKIDGNYTIHYVGKYAWSHLSVNGSGGSSSPGSSSNDSSGSSSSSSSGGPAGYTFCVDENGTCSFSGTREVAYGAYGQFIYQTATGSIACNNTTFGDPIYGVVKACYYANDQSDDSDNSDNGQACDLPASLYWTSSQPIITPRNGNVSVKDPTIVNYNGRYHVFATSHDDNRYGSIYLNFTDFNQAGAANQVDFAPGGSHTVAPQVFYFEPQNKWYIITQWGGRYSTNTNINNPNGWSSLKSLLSGEPSGSLDFWVICNDTHCYLFFLRDDGALYMSKTTIDNFPNFSGYTTVMSGDKNILFEAANVYKLRGLNKYLLLVEGWQSGPRFFRAWTSSSLDGPWTAYKTSESDPFAGSNNVSFPGGQWTKDISQGEMIRSGYNQKMEIDACNMQYLYQGVDPNSTNVPYNLLPWNLGLITAN